MKFRCLAILFLFFLFHSCSVIAQPFKVSGYVNCSGTNLVIKGAVITLKGKDGSIKTTVTDSLGYYELHCDTLMYSIKASSDEFFKTELGTKKLKYFASEVQIIDFTKGGGDAAINIEMERVIDSNCRFDLKFDLYTLNYSGNYHARNISSYFKIDQFIRLELVGYVAKGEADSLRTLRAEKVRRDLIALGMDSSVVTVNFSAPNQTICSSNFDCFDNQICETDESPKNARVEIFKWELKD